MNLKKPTSLIGRDFPKNLNVKLPYLCELGVLCERQLHNRTSRLHLTNYNACNDSLQSKSREPDFSRMPT